MVLEETAVSRFDEEESTTFVVEEFGEFALEGVAKGSVLLFAHEKTDYSHTRENIVSQGLVKTILHLHVFRILYARS